MNSRKDKQKQTTGKFPKKKVSIIAGVLAGLLLSGYLFGVFFYSTNVLKTVVYDNQKTGIKQYSDIDSYMKQVIESKKVSIVTADTNEKFEIPMKALEPQYSLEEAKKDLKSQTNPWRWPIQLFTRSVLGLHVKMTINGELLKQRLTDVGLFDNSKRVATNDAKITVSDKGVVIEPEKSGTQLDEEKTFLKIQEALDKGEVTIDVSDCTIPPLTSEKDLEVLKQEAQGLIDTPISLTLGGVKQTLTLEQKSALLTIDDKEKKVAISKEATIKLLTDFNNQYIKSQGGTTATSVVEFGSGTARIVSNASNIMTMNVETEVNTIKAAMESKKALDYTPVVKANIDGSYTYKNTSGTVSKNGRHFVEVSIPEQKLWIYQGDKVVLSADIVTGMESSAKFTPTIRGVFQILYKQQGATLRGSTVGYTGDQDYNVKVNYWIPFDSQGYGFHDAEGWKPFARYGGTYYKTEGSHGCVNMRNKDVKVLFDTVATGAPVWVHE